VRLLNCTQCANHLQCRFAIPPILGNTSPLSPYPVVELLKKLVVRTYLGSATQSPIFFIVATMSTKAPAALKVDIRRMLDRMQV